MFILTGNVISTFSIFLGSIANDKKILRGYILGQDLQSNGFYFISKVQRRYTMKIEMFIVGPG